MKKLLSLISAISLTAVATVPVVACNRWKNLFVDDNGNTKFVTSTGELNLDLNVENIAGWMDKFNTLKEDTITKFHSLFAINILNDFRLDEKSKILKLVKEEYKDTYKLIIKQLKDVLGDPLGEDTDGNNSSIYSRARKDMADFIKKTQDKKSGIKALLEAFGNKFKSFDVRDNDDDAKLKIYKNLYISDFLLDSSKTNSISALQSAFTLKTSGPNTVKDPFNKDSSVLGLNWEAKDNKNPETQELEKPNSAIVSLNTIVDDSVKGSQEINKNTSPYKIFANFELLMKNKLNSTDSKQMNLTEIVNLIIEKMKESKDEETKIILDFINLNRGNKDFIDLDSLSKDNTDINAEFITKVLKENANTEINDETIFSSSFSWDILKSKKAEVSNQKGLMNPINFEWQKNNFQKVYSNIFVSSETVFINGSLSKTQKIHSNEYFNKENPVAFSEIMLKSKDKFNLSEAVNLDAFFESDNATKFEQQNIQKSFSAFGAILENILPKTQENEETQENPQTTSISKFDQQFRMVKSEFTNKTQFDPTNLLVNKGNNSYDKDNKDFNISDFNSSVLTSSQEVKDDGITSTFKNAVYSYVSSDSEVAQITSDLPTDDDISSFAGLDTINNISKLRLYIDNIKKQIENQKADALDSKALLGLGYLWNIIKKFTDENHKKPYVELDKGLIAIFDNKGLRIVQIDGYDILKSNQASNNNNNKEDENIASQIIKMLSNGNVKDENTLNLIKFALHSSSKTLEEFENNVKSLKQDPKYSDSSKIFNSTVLEQINPKTFKELFKLNSLNNSLNNKYEKFLINNSLLKKVIPLNVPKKEDLKESEVKISELYNLDIIENISKKIDLAFSKDKEEFKYSTWIYKVLSESISGTNSLNEVFSLFFKKNEKSKQFEPMVWDLYLFMKQRMDDERTQTKFKFLDEIEEFNTKKQIQKSQLERDLNSNKKQPKEEKWFKDINWNESINFNNLSNIFNNKAQGGR